MNAVPRCFLGLLAILTLLGTSACQRTLFQHAPAEAEACDPALVGRWLSQGDRPEENGEIEARVDANCRLQVFEHEHGGTKTSPTTTLRNARVDGTRYLWVDAGWANQAFEIDATPLDQAGDVYLFAYQPSRDRLRLAGAPERALAHRVLDKDIAGEVMLHDENLTVRLEGEPAAIRKTLRKHRLFRFNKDALTFVKAEPGDSP